jgi:K+-transporting ATPase c subunit
MSANSGVLRPRSASDQMLLGREGSRKQSGSEHIGSWFIVSRYVRQRLRYLVEDFYQCTAIGIESAGSSDYFLEAAFSSRARISAALAAAVAPP